MKHNKEPWKTHSLWLPPNNETLWIETSDGKATRICDMASGDVELNRENAGRIVECVNACQGINPKAIPKMLRALDEAIGEMIQMLSANEPGGVMDRGLRAALEHAEQAVAMAKAKK